MNLERKIPGGSGKQVVPNSAFQQYFVPNSVFQSFFVPNSANSKDGERFTLISAQLENIGGFT